MGRRISYNRGPSNEELAAARKAREDTLFRQGLIQVTAIIIVSFLLTGIFWYIEPQQEWWKLLCMPPLLALGIVSGIFRLIRWLGV